MWGHPSHLILMDWIMKKMHSCCRLALFRVQEWHVYIRKRQEIREHSYNIVIGFYILKTKKAGETKRRNQGEERHPDKRNERIKNTKKR